MRKPILIAVFVLASAVTAHAGQNRGLVLAAANAPAQTQSAVAPSAQAEAQPAPSQVQAPQPSRPVKSSRVRHRESDEAKARRIAATASTGSDGLAAMVCFAGAGQNSFASPVGSGHNRSFLQ